MSSFRRLGNLAKGLFKVEARRWTEGDPPEPPELRPPAAPRAPARAATPDAPAPPSASAPPARTGPELDENGEVKRTL